MLGELLHSEPVGTGIVAVPSECYLLNRLILVDTDIPDILRSTSLNGVGKDVVACTSLILHVQSDTENALVEIGHCRVLLSAAGDVGVLERPLP